MLRQILDHLAREDRALVLAGHDMILTRIRVFPVDRFLQVLTTF